jgi:hypothetical protein
MSPAGSRAAYRVTFPAGTRARVGDAVYEILSARATGDNPGEVALDLSVRMTNNGRFAANFWDASFRLVVDGVSRAPTSGLDEIVDGRSAKEGTVSFVVPAAARRLVLRVGERDTVGLPVALRRTG